MAVSPAAIQGVDQYIAEFVPQLMSRLNEEVRPIYDPTQEPTHPALGTLKRKPFRAQADAMTGIVKVLERQDFAILVGEMGTGKTLMGLSVPYALWGNGFRVLIMCPGHLVEKWAREITQTVPDSTVRILWKFSDVLALEAEKDEPKGREYYVIARDRAKLGYSWKPAFVHRRRPYRAPADWKGINRSEYRAQFTRSTMACPRCGRFILDENESPADEAWLSRRKRKCACGEHLWEADRTRFRRYAPAEYIKSHLRGFFDMAIFDEVHELKGGDTAQGNTMGMLARAAKKTLCLTGTLIGGYAEHLFYILYRVNPRGLKSEGFRYKDVQEYVRRYGSLEFIRKTRLGGSDLRTARGKESHEVVKHRPGVSPLVFARHLLGSTVFLELADVADQLTAFAEDVTVVDMSPELASAYKKVEEPLKEALKDRTQSNKILGTYISTLLSYPDRPFANPPIPVVGELPELDEDAIYPKEEALLRFVKEELRHERRVWVFATFTNRKDVTRRLAELFQKEGLSVVVLRQDTVELHKREAWVKDQVDRGIEVVISNPELVKTGLDLLDFPSIAFYECGYNCFTLMQASRRSWRIGQQEPVSVRYLCYKGTLQEAALRLMGAKVKAAMTLQGKFSQEGLTALTQSEDMMTALARALLTGIDGVESAETYWRSRRTTEAQPPARVPAAFPVPTPRANRKPEKVAARPPAPALREATWVTLDLFEGLADFSRSASKAEEATVKIPSREPVSPQLSLGF